LCIEQPNRSVNENHQQILLYRLEKSALEEHSNKLAKLTCLARPKFWPKKLGMCLDLMTWKAIQTATSNNVDKEADLSSCKQ
jgi:hypothetical protein